MNILVVEDEIRLSETIAQLLVEQRYSADIVHNGDDGLEYALSGQYDVVILDVMLPGLDGCEVARRLRQAKNATPVLMLTARSEVSDKVKGLDCGADDYMTKPFSPAGGCAARGHPLGGLDPQAFFPHAALRRKVGQPGL